MTTMMIRPYRDSDYEAICTWWAAADGVSPPRGGMVEDGTFVLDMDALPSLSLTVLKTQSCFALLEGFIARPEMQRDVRRAASQQLFEHCCRYARDNGFEYVLIYAKNGRLAERYEELGMTKCLDGLTGLARRVS